MVDSNFLLTVILFAVSMSVSPGPNNIMLLGPGMNFGLMKTLLLLCGITMGFLSLLVCVATLLGTAFQIYLGIHVFLKYAGAAYILYLSLQIVRSTSGVKTGKTSRLIGFTKAALFQAASPNAWVIASGAVAAYTGNIHFVRDVTTLVVSFLVVTPISCSIWIVVGERAALLLGSDKIRVLNTILSIFLVLSVVPTVADK